MVPGPAVLATRRLPMPPFAAGSCDCHIHINDPRFAYVAGADLHPAPATVQDYRALQARLGLSRVVVVQPSSYGTDNRCLVAALEAFGPDARGVAVVDRHMDEAQLQALHAAGVRGIRFNLLRPSPVDVGDLEGLAERVAPLGWHLQLHAGPDQVVALEARLLGLAVPVVFDHFARIDPSVGERHRAFQTLCRMLDAGRAWVKLSGHELDAAADAPAYAPHAALARALLVRAPQRMLWGTNWPHPAAPQSGPGRVDDAALLAWIAATVPDEALRHAVLVSNPGRLYFA